MMILQAPSSFDFKEGEKVELSDVGKMLATSLGYSIQEPSKWKGFNMDNPFTTPRVVVFLNVNGIESFHFDQIKPKTFPVTGEETLEPIADVAQRVETEHAVAVELDFNQGAAAVRIHFYAC